MPLRALSWPLPPPSWEGPRDPSPRHTPVKMLTLVDLYLVLAPVSPLTEAWLSLASADPRLTRAPRFLPAT